MLIHSVTTDLLLRMMGMMDDKAPKGCPAYTSLLIGSAAKRIQTASFFDEDNKACS